MGAVRLEGREHGERERVIWTADGAFQRGDDEMVRLEMGCMCMIVYDRYVHIHIYISKYISKYTHKHILI